MRAQRAAFDWVQRQRVSAGKLGPWRDDILYLRAMGCSVRSIAAFLASQGTPVQPMSVYRFIQRHQASGAKAPEATRKIENIQPTRAPAPTGAKAPVGAGAGAGRDTEVSAAEIEKMHQLLAMVRGDAT
jgi:hypothetical protein